MPAEVTSLAAFRARRAGVAHPGSPPQPVAPAYLRAEAGTVVFELSNGAAFELSTRHARIWAERLAAMADVADELDREGRR